MSKNPQTASQFAGTEEGSPAALFTPLPGVTDAQAQSRMHTPSHATTSGQRKQVSRPILALSMTLSRPPLRWSRLWKLT